MKKIGIVFGSPSEEHEVSLAGTESVLKALKSIPGYEAKPIGIDKSGNWYTGENALATLITKANKEMLLASNIDTANIEKTEGHAAPPLDYIAACDYIMIIIPGKHGEDGNLQGFFNTLGKRVIGCDTLSSALCFDKSMLKATLAGYGFLVAPGVDVHLDQTQITPELYDQICKEVDSPRLVIKPTDNGSSIGLSQAENFEEFKSGLLEAQKHTNHVLVEKFIPHIEIAAGVIGNGNDLLISDLGNLNESDTHVYSYDEKYVTSKPYQVPADIDPQATQKIKEMTAEIFKLVKCSDWARIDFFIEKGTNKIFLNEINTIPGMTELSLFPQIFKGTGFDYIQMVEEILNRATADETLKAAA